MTIYQATVIDGTASIEISTDNITTGTHNITARYNQNDNYKESTTTSQLTVQEATITPTFTIYAPLSTADRTQTRDKFTEEKEYCLKEYCDYCENVEMVTPVRIYANNEFIVLLTGSSSVGYKLRDNQGNYGIFPVYKTTDLSEEIQYYIQILPNPYLNIGGGGVALLHTVTNPLTIMEA